MTRRQPFGKFPTDRRAATVVEFALLAPVFLAMLFAIVEGSRFLWVKQSLKEVAFSTARCTAVGTDCDTAANRVRYAVTRATAYRQTVAGTDVVVTTNTTCNAAAGMVKVTISIRFRSPVAGILPKVPASVAGTGCYPVLRT